MRYIYLGTAMLLASTILAFLYYGWMMAVIVFLAVQGNEIVQRANAKILNVGNAYFNDGVTKYDDKLAKDWYSDYERHGRPT